MMHGVAMISFLAFVARAGAQDSIDSLADTLINKFVTRADKVGESQYADLDGAMLGKGEQLAISGRTSLLPLGQPGTLQPRNSLFKVSPSFMSHLSSYKPQYNVQAATEPRETIAPWAAAQESLPVIQWTSEQLQGLFVPGTRLGEGESKELSSQEEEDATNGESPDNSAQESQVTEAKALESRVVDAMALIVSAKGVAMAALRHGVDQRAKAAAAMAMSAMLVVTQQWRHINSATKDLTEAAQPIIASLKSPISSKDVMNVDPKEIVKTIDAGLDAFLSVPPEKFKTLVRALKAATSEAAGATKECNLSCLPSLAASERVAAAAANALACADQAKLKAFADVIKPFKPGQTQPALAAALVLIDGGKLSSSLPSLNPDDVARVSAAALEVIKASSV